MSTMQSPPPDAPVPPGPPERHCPRCGSTLGPEQEWCLACGAAADTEIVEARGWRVPLYLSGGLVALAILGVVLAIVALSSNKEQVAPNPKTAGVPSAVPTAPVPTIAPTTTPDPLATTTPDPNATTTPDPNATTTPEPTPTEDPNTTTGTGSTFPGWPGGSGYTIIIESNDTQSGAEKVAADAQAAGETVGVLNSDDFSSLNGGYWVVFTEKYATEQEAEDALPDVQSSHSDAYVRKITPA